MRYGDAQLTRLVRTEEKRQRRTLNLVASENIVPPAVLKLLGSALTNKYSEGYPGRRYYPGCGIYDRIELLAQKRARQAFGLSSRWRVNVQAYSGAVANMAVYLALAKPGATILSMNLTSGGHLSHGSKASFTGKLFRVVHYGVTKSYDIDYRALARLAKKHKPAIIISGASAYPKKIDFKRIGLIAHRVGAYHVADIAHYAGLIAAGVYPSPFRHADVVTTTTHKSLLGPRAAIIFSNSKSTTAEKNGIDIAASIDKAVFPGLQGGPHNNAIAAVAYSLWLVQKPAFETYARQVIKNARLLVRELSLLGFHVVGGGTDSHMILVDVSKLGMDGKEAEERLEKTGILANRNTIAGDTSPLRPSAIRMGTYWITARGMKESDLKSVARKIYKVLVRK